jgi:hypothetical protein
VFWKEDTHCKGDRRKHDKPPYVLIWMPLFPCNKRIQIRLLIVGLGGSGKAPTDASIVHGFCWLIRCQSLIQLRNLRFRRICNAKKAFIQLIPFKTNWLMISWTEKPANYLFDHITWILSLEESNSLTPLRSSSSLAGSSITVDAHFVHWSKQKNFYFYW